jgi:hypothetical protein
MNIIPLNSECTRGPDTFSPITNSSFPSDAQAVIYKQAPYPL